MQILRSTSSVVVVVVVHFLGEMDAFSVSNRLPLLASVLRRCASPYFSEHHDERKISAGKDLGLRVFLPQSQESQQVSQRLKGRRGGACSCLPASSSARQNSYPSERHAKTYVRATQHRVGVLLHDYMSKKDDRRGLRSFFWPQSASGSLSRCCIQRLPLHDYDY